MKKQKPKCAIEGCLRRAFARNLCRAHYGRWWRHGTFEHRITGKVLKGEDEAVKDFISSSGDAAAVRHQMNLDEEALKKCSMPWHAAMRLKRYLKGG